MLRSAQQASSAAYDEAIAHPGDRAPVGRLLSWYVPGDQGYKAMSALMRRLAADGFAGRTGPKEYQVIEGVHLSAGGAQGAVTICTYDDGVIYDTNLKDAKGVPVVVNDDVVSRLSVSHWIRRDGSWRETQTVEKKTWPDVNRCPAKAPS